MQFLGSSSKNFIGPILILGRFFFNNKSGIWFRFQFFNVKVDFGSSYRVISK
jgi:hypothetical protein